MVRITTRRYGYYSLDVMDVFSKDEISFIKRTNKHYNWPYFDALVTAYENNIDDCIKNLREWYGPGKFKHPYTESDFFDDIFVVFRNPFPNFYKKLKDNVYNNDKGVDEVVLNICDYLDEYFLIPENQYKKRIDCLSKFLDTNPESMIGNIIMGDLFFSNHQYEYALQYMLKVESKEVEPDDAFYSMKLPSFRLLYIAEVYDKLKNDDKSVQYYRKLLSQYPNDLPEARNNLGWKLYKLKKYDEALIEFKKCIDEGISLSYSANNYAKTLIALKDGEKLEEYISNPPIKLRKYTMDISHKFLNKYYNEETDNNSINNS